MHLQVHVAIIVLKAMTFERVVTDENGGILIGGDGESDGEEEAWSVFLSILTIKLSVR